MGTMTMKEARIRFSALVRAAEHGQSVTITRRGKIVARVVPAAETRKCRKAPDLTAFRASIQARGTTLSQAVIALRRKAR